MKATPLFLFLLVCFTGLSQRIIPIDSVKYYEKQLVRVCGLVIETKQDTATGTVFLDLDGRYPHAKLSVVIFREDLSGFRSDLLSFYLGKRICVTGVIARYKKWFQVQVEDEDAVELQ